MQRRIKTGANHLTEKLYELLLVPNRCPVEATRERIVRTQTVRLAMGLLQGVPQEFLALPAFHQTPGQAGLLRQVVAQYGGGPITHTEPMHASLLLAWC